MGGPVSEPLASYSESVDFVAVPWDTFLAWLDDNWRPGQHMAIIMPTGEGKTTFAVNVLGLRKWVLALDPKGMDETLEASGFRRITKLPLPRDIRNDISEGRPARLIVGGSTRTKDEHKELRRLMGEAIEMVRGQGGWTVYADEFQILADRRMFNLGTEIELLLISARSNRTSVVTSFQAAAWVPKASTRQATLAVLGPTRDRAMIRNVGQAMGRHPYDLSAVVDQLPPFHLLVIPRNIRAPLIIVKAPYVG